MASLIFLRTWLREVLARVIAAARATLAAAFAVSAIIEAFRIVDDDEPANTRSTRDNISDYLVMVLSNASIRGAHCVVVADAFRFRILLVEPVRNRMVIVRRQVNVNVHSVFSGALG